MRIFLYSIFILLLLCSYSSALDYGVTVFGTDLLTKEDLIQNFSKELEELRSLYDSDRETYNEKKDKLSDILQTNNKFAYTNIRLFKSYSDEYDFIIDVVESIDVNKRLNYRQFEPKQLEDPNGLIAKWIEYENLSYELFAKGEISDYSCPVIHCLWSFNHPKLEPYLDFFNTNAKKYKEQLINILYSSDSTSYRASAAFLLAHAELSNEELLHTLLPAIKDPKSSVRNSSMRVIYYIVRKYPELQFDISEVINALDFPSFTDRNKALVILRSISLADVQSDELLRLAEILIEILEKKDAHNYKNAYTVIKKLSSKEFAIDDIESWKKWRDTYHKI